MRRFEFLIFVLFFCSSICLALHTGGHVVVIHVVAKTESGDSWKCSNLTAGLCLFLFTSQWVSFQRRKVRHVVVQLGMAPDFWLLGWIVFYFTLKSKVHIYPCSKLKGFKIHTTTLWRCHCLFSMYWVPSSHNPSTAWSQFFPLGIRLRADLLFDFPGDMNKTPLIHYICFLDTVNFPVKQVWIN